MYVTHLINMRFCVCEVESCYLPPCCEVMVRVNSEQIKASHHAAQLAAGSVEEHPERFRLQGGSNRSPELGFPDG